MPRKRRRVTWTGDQIRSLRQHLGLTQEEMASELGTRQQTISEWERGLYRPRGASSTLLMLVAERALFPYQPILAGETEVKKAGTDTKND